MYGLINRAIEELAVSIGGQDCWEAIRARAGFADPTFLNIESYPDELTFRLVDAAAEVLRLDRDDVLQRFGAHWVHFVETQGYGSLILATGSDFRQCVRNLDRMHAKIGLAMPNLDPPSFLVSDIDDSLLQIDYFSSRDGLTQMVIGLLYGIARRFKQRIDVTLLTSSETRPGAKASMRVRVLQLAETHQVSG